ncbi:type II toxin-antitoxin system TacA family antitoxin [Patulibacter defluvii]|uniref:type II toxin-antitoxin system TacA family antitoxin n=1 Tax=Patulibacter defluvii TaxID=3095358 RepID=UPI002A764637|nr:DUF1778 domain-containing protein [Patulibacter sp. DM4]
MPPTTRDERLQIRVDAHDKRVLERAAAASHLSLSAFVLQAAWRQAEEVLVDSRFVALPAHAAEAFEEALARPAEVNERLATALGRPRRFRWVD